MTPDTPELLPVIQADREAAEPFRRGIGGGYDRKHEALVQAFARHRIRSPREGETERLVAALEAIVNWKPRPYPFPADWQAQIDDCEECQGYSGHPIQRGICDEHRRPIWAREAHVKHEEGPARAAFCWLTAHDALAEYRRACAPIPSKPHTP